MSKKAIKYFIIGSIFTSLDSGSINIHSTSVPRSVNLAIKKILNFNDYGMPLKYDLEIEIDEEFIDLSISEIGHGMGGLEVYIRFDGSIKIIEVGSA